LDIFEDGLCPDLKSKFEEAILTEKQTLEALVERTVATEKSIGIPVNQLKDNAFNLAREGIILRDQIIDYKELTEELSRRVQQLTEQNKELV
jgi:hypothetical protein